MLRPATPLTVLLFAAFALLLISILSTPIIKSIPLASFDGVNFGVFGFCQGSKCSNIEIGYNAASLYNPAQDATFDLPANTRTTLTAILIIHPIAAFFTLIMLVLAASAHFHSPSHSPRYLLGIFILSILTLILALLAFLIDVLLFVPHMAWGSYIVLAATILIAASGIVSCAMRRTLVSRKARKRRIAENAEMNGENFYNRQGTDPVAPIVGNNLVNGGPGVDKLPAFATFEMAKKDEERTSDERIPLTTRTPSETSPSNMPGVPVNNERYGGPPPVMGAGPARDQSGNPIVPPPGAYGGSRSRDPSTDPSLNRQYSDNSMNSRGRGMPPGGYRGRGYPMNGRGNYGPPPRGYFNGPRGGYGPQRGGYGGPPGPYRGPPGGMNDGMMAAGAVGAGAMMRGGGASRGRGAPPGYGPPRSYDRGQSPGHDGYGRRPYPPDAYGRDASPAPQSAGGYAPYNPDDSRSSFPRAESPPPLPSLVHEGGVGQAVEMDATTGSPSAAPRGFGQFGHLRDSDADVAGMVGLQQQGIDRHHTVISESSRYSSDGNYVPPRQAWGEAGRSSPLNSVSQPVELPSPTGLEHRRVHSGDNYFEDVDPRFAEPPPALVPGPLVTGYHANNSSNNRLQPGGLEGNNSFEDIQDGARSPAESDRSNFTSISQRGVNPRWNPGPAGYGPPMPNKRPVNAPQRNDILNSNPDFHLPGTAGRGGRGGFPGRGGRGNAPPMGASMVPGSAYPGAGAL